MVLTAQTQTQAYIHSEREREKENGGNQKGYKNRPYNIKCCIFSLSATF